MSGDLSTIEKFVEENMIDLMAEKVMSVGIQASSMGRFQASPSNGRRSMPSRIVTEKISKHHDNMENAKQILSVFPDYIPPLAGAVSHENIPHHFEYTLTTAYLPKWIHATKQQLGLIPDLKINDFNLGDQNNYAMLALHRYLTKTTGKKPNIAFPAMD
jgi:hypothetical protein